MAFIKSNGIKIYYEIHGQGKPLVLISGLGGDLTFWQASIKKLAAENQVIIFDTRGSGKTDAPETPYSMELLANDLLGMMDSLKIDKFSILGFSMGGNIALTFALLYPDLVSKLIVAASFPVMNKQARLFLNAILSVYETCASTKQMFELIVPWLFSPEFLSRPENEIYLNYDENESDKQPFYAWRNQYLVQQVFDITKQLSNIETPALIIAACNDRLAHVADAQILADQLPNAELQIISDSGHLMNFEQPELFHRCVLNFLNT